MLSQSIFSIYGCKTFEKLIIVSRELLVQPFHDDSRCFFSFWYYPKFCFFMFIVSPYSYPLSTILFINRCSSLKFSANIACIPNIVYRFSVYLFVACLSLESFFQGLFGVWEVLFISSSAAEINCSSVWGGLMQLWTSLYTKSNMFSIGF